MKYCWGHWSPNQQSNNQADMYGRSPMGVLEDVKEIKRLVTRKYVKVKKGLVSSKKCYPKDILVSIFFLGSF